MPAAAILDSTGEGSEAIAKSLGKWSCMMPAFLRHTVQAPASVSALSPNANARN